MSTLNLFPARVPIGTVNVNGVPTSVLMTPEFFRALSDLLQRVGGVSGVDLSGIVDLVNQALQNSLDAQLVQSVDPHAAVAESSKEIAALAGQLYQSAAYVAEMSKRVDWLEAFVGQSDPERVNWERPGRLGVFTANSVAATTLDASGAVTLNPANANVVASPTGTGVVTIAPATAGSMNNMTVGNVTPRDGAFLVLRGNSLAYVIADTPTAQSIPNNASTIITNWTERTDLNNNFNPVTGVFTAPRTGKYTVTAMVTYANAAFAAGSEATIVVHVNGGQARAGRFEIPVVGTMVFSSPPSPFPLFLTAGDTVDVRAYQNSGAAVNTNSSINTWVTIEEKP